MSDIRRALQKHKLEPELGGHVDFIEREFNQMKDVMISSGTVGLNLSLVFHEVEHAVQGLYQAIASGERQENLKMQANHLINLLEGFAPLLKQSGQKIVKITDILKRIRQLNESRFSHHKIVFSCPVITGENPEFQIRGPVNLFINTINNLVDNAIYWSRRRRELENNQRPAAIGIYSLPDWFSEGPCIVVADNGPGFRISMEDAVRPFVSTRVGGMGLGLYYANLVMESNGGQLMIITPDELELPRHLDGAAIVLRFKGDKN